MIYILCGEMGVGKNYVGKRLANYLNCQFLDGDDIIPKEMKDRVKGFKFLPAKMISNFVKDDLAPAIVNNSLGADNLVVAQALYKWDDRQALRNKLVFNYRFIYIVPCSFWTHMRRILKRSNYYGIKMQGGLDEK